MRADLNRNADGFERTEEVTPVKYIDHPDQRRITVAEVRAAESNLANALCLARGVWKDDQERMHRTGRCINPEAHVRLGDPHSWENEDGTIHA